MPGKITELAALTTPADDDLLEIVDISDTSMAGTGTNKRITVDDLRGPGGGGASPYTSRSTTTTASLTPDAGTYDQENVTALAEAMTINNPTGTVSDGRGLTIRILAVTSDRALTWGAAYNPVGFNLPTLARTGRKLYLGFRWDSATSTWDLIGLAEEAT